MTSPSQNSEELESFLTKFEHSETYVDSSIPVKSSVSVILDDFNAKSTSWWSNEIDSAEGTKSSSRSFSTSNGFHQWIDEPTHIQRNCSSFIDLTFTDQPSSVESTHHYTQAKLCHHQIIHCTFNLNIVYPLLVNTQFGTTKNLMFQIYKKLYNWWNVTDCLIINVNSEVLLFNDITLNIFRNSEPIINYLWWQSRT